MTNKMTDRESDSDLAAWAKALAATITPDELARLVAQYREQAGNPRRLADDREFADRRARALAKVQKQNR